jgi:hypothetical protein
MCRRVEKCFGWRCDIDEMKAFFDGVKMYRETENGEPMLHV